MGYNANVRINKTNGMIQMKRYTHYLAALLLSAATLPVLADDEEINAERRHPLLEDKFSASVGAFFHQKDIALAVNGQAPIDEIDFDERWALSDDKTSAAVNFRWKFGEKWSIWGQYFDTSDSGVAVLDEDISWGDLTLQEGSNVGAGVGLSVARIVFGRIFSEGPKHEFGIAAGLHWLEVSAYLEGEFFLNDIPLPFDRESVSADAPLPNIGGWYGYAFNRNWVFSARLDWLSASVGDYSGGLWNSQVGIHFQPWENFGFLAAYQSFELDVDVDKESWRGSIDLRYNGPYVALTANW